MADQEKNRKKIVVHVGPHKTGSTAIQSWLHANSDFLQSHSLAFIHSTETHRMAKLIAAENYFEAEEILKLVAARISRMPAETIILSQEDFSGELPGRSKKRGTYSRLVKNLRVIKRSLAPHEVVFLFFERAPHEWLRSCYHQNLVYRTQFAEFSAFQEYVGGTPDWNAVLAKSQNVVKNALRRVTYSRAPDSGVRAVLSAGGVEVVQLPNAPDIVNRSPSETAIAALERINSFSSFPGTAWFSKKLLLRGWSPVLSSPDQSACRKPSSQLAVLAFPDLLGRAHRRFPKQEADDLLPDESADLGDYMGRRLPTDVAEPNVSRTEMRDQSLLLDFHLRGKSELAKLNALSISYLRRDTPHTNKARNLFHRIWREYGVALVNELSTRWIISTLQTFLDHGANEAQRLIGGCGYFYANMIKIYEGERAIEGLSQDGPLPRTEPVTKSKFRGLDRYRIGGTDLLLNTNALALELSTRDDVAGLILQEFLLRVRHSGNVFTRSDATRVLHGIEIDGFEDTWSFYVKPGITEKSDAGTSV